MKCFFILFCLLVFQSIAFPQEQTDTNKTIIKPIINEVLLPDTVFSNLSFYNLESDGVWRTRYESGRIKAEGNRIRKFDFKCLCFYYIMDGTWIYYNEKGEVEREVVYKKGVILSTKKR